MDRVVRDVLLYVRTATADVPLASHSPVGVPVIRTVRRYVLTLTATTGAGGALRVEMTAAGLLLAAVTLVHVVVVVGQGEIGAQDVVGLGEIQQPLPVVPVKVLGRLDARGQVGSGQLGEEALARRARQIWQGVQDLHARHRPRDLLDFVVG